MNNDYNNHTEQSSEQPNNQSGYQYGNPGQNSYGQNPYGQNPYGQPPYSHPSQPIASNNAKNCFTMGLLSIVCIFVMQILSIIFGALALNYAKKSKIEMGYECPDAKNGRLMGLIGLIIGSILTGLVVLAYLILFISLLLI